MKSIKSIKTNIFLLIFFLISLAIIYFDRYKYTTISDIRFHTYVLFSTMILSFYGFFILTFFKTAKSPEKIESKTDKIINYIHLVIVFLTVLAIGFGLMLTNAYVEHPVDNSIEEVRRFLEQYKIITLGRDIYINSTIALVIATGIRLFYFGVKSSIKE